MHAPTPYSMVFLLHAPAPTPIKIGFGVVWCGSYGCVGEAYTPTYHNSELEGFDFFFFFLISIQRKTKLHSLVNRYCKPYRRVGII
jgi:hypothetical protein